MKLSTIKRRSRNAFIMPQYWRLMLGVLLIMPVVGCEDELSLRPAYMNLHGDFARTNSYERYGTFTSTLVMQNELEEESAAGFSRIRGVYAIAPPLPLTSEETYMATSDGHVLRAYWNNIRWKAALDSGELVAAAMCADSSENVYAVSSKGKVYAIAYSGERLWVRDVFTPGSLTSYSDLLAMPSGILAASSSGTIVLLSYDGATLWRIDSQLSPTRTAAADSDGRIAIALTHSTFHDTDTLLFVDSTGQRIWSRGFPQTRLIKSPVIGANIILIAGLRQTGDERIPVLHALSSMGQVLWSLELPVMARGISHASDGTTYVVGYNAGIGEPLSVVMAISRDGAMLWDLSFELALPTAALISEETLAMVGTKGKATGLYFVTRSGEFRNVVSLSNAPVLNLQPAVDPNGSVVFAATETLGLVKVGETAVTKLLPF